MRLPSINTLRQVFDNDARKALAILEMDRAQLEALPAGAARIAQCYNPVSTRDLRMTCLDALGHSYGVEAITLNTSRVGQVMYYLNTGDTYSPTLIYLNGRYTVACWGDMVERYGAY